MPSLAGLLGAWDFVNQLSTRLPERLEYRLCPNIVGMLSPGQAKDQPRRSVDPQQERTVNNKYPGTTAFAIATGTRDQTDSPMVFPTAAATLKLERASMVERHRNAQQLPHTMIRQKHHDQKSLIVIS